MADVCYNKTKMYGWTVLLHSGFPAEAFVKPTGLVPDGKRSESVAVNSSCYAGVFKSEVVFKNKVYSLFLKIFFYRSAKDFFLHQFRPSRAVRAFKAAAMLSANGINAPVSIALGAKKILGTIKTGSFLITSEVADSRLFYELLDELANSESTVNEKRKLVIALGEMVGKMHYAGIFHGDLRLGNILVQQSQAQYKFTLLDNERTRKFTTLPGRLRVKNLVQVGMYENGLTRTDRMRFFAAYLRNCKNCEIPSEELVKRVWKKTQKRLEKKRFKTV
ncbi:MAG: lipopolysaccharide kinase InaA family protein [Anaerohalosphaeraceae bacterium]|nr:lipopolysaccharide kinase InaA family protein [Anaerohalosphaeraceae bacterium]